MNVISSHQPYASLVMAGIKLWETRPYPPNGDMRPKGVRGLPGKQINRGDRIGIAATKRWAPGWCRWYNPDRNDADADMVNVLDSVGVDFFEGEGQWYLDRLSLPLGVLLGTVEAVRALPIVFYDDGPPAGWDESSPIIDTATDNGIRRLTLWDRGDIEGYEKDISDQVLFGHWVPGGWAWQLANPEPFAAPIPVKGKQGVWEWAP